MKNSKQKLKTSRQTKLKVYSPNVYTQRPSTRVGLRRETPLSVSTSNLNKPKSRSKSKLANKRMSKSAGRMYGRQSNKAKFKLKRKKQRSRKLSMIDVINATFTIQKHWRAYIERKMNQPKHRTSLESTLQGRQKLKHSFSFGIDIKSNEAHEKSMQMTQNRQMIESNQDTGIMLYDPERYHNKTGC